MTFAPAYTPLCLPPNPSVYRHGILAARHCSAPCPSLHGRAWGPAGGFFSEVIPSNVFCRSLLFTTNPSSLQIGCMVRKREIKRRTLPEKLQGVPFLRMCLNHLSMPCFVGTWGAFALFFLCFEGSCQEKLAWLSQEAA